MRPSRSAAASQEVRARLDRLPFTILRLARSRLPAGLRDRIHDQERVPELDHVLQHAELFPLTRLVTGLRFAAGLLIRAGTIAAELQPAEALEQGGSQDRSWPQRLARGPTAVLRTLLWLVGLPLPVRLYVAAVIMAAGAATAVAAALVPAHARDLELCAFLLCCGLIAHGAPAAAHVPVVSDLMGTCLLPVAVLLPPFYALIAPVPLFALDQLRHPGPAYRRVFSAAASSLAYGAVSALTHTAARQGRRCPPGSRSSPPASFSPAPRPPPALPRTKPGGSAPTPRR